MISMPILPISSNEISNEINIKWDIDNHSDCTLSSSTLSSFRPHLENYTVSSAPPSIQSLEAEENMNGGNEKYLEGTHDM